MKKIYIEEFIHNDPPSFFITWCDLAVKKYLKSQGFDLNKRIWFIEDLKNGNHFTQ